MKKCTDIKQIVDRWEETGIITEGDRETIRTHSGECPECRRRFSSLLPLLERDLGAPERALQQSDSEILPSANFADSVMEQIAATGKRDRGTPKLPYIAAAAGFIIAVAGLLFGLYGTGIIGTTGTAEQYIEVSFVLTAPEADAVHLVGDFTDWEDSKIVLEDPDKDGVWEAVVKLRKGEVYSYNFVIDGKEWIPDPNSLMQVDDGFGGESSLLTL